MAHSSVILDALRATALAGASTSELCTRTGIASRSSVYHATRDLMLQGLVRGERIGHSWRFFASNPAPVAVDGSAPDLSFSPLPEYGWEQVRSDAGWQARYLAALVATPSGCAWLMHKLDSPCSKEESEHAVILQHTYPLRDMLFADAQLARGDHAREDAFMSYYNGMLGLPAGFGLEHTWRSGSEGRLRLPGEHGHNGWTTRHLKTSISTKRQLHKAARIVELLQLQVDMVFYTPRHVMLVQVYQPGKKASLKQFELLRRYAAVMERRLQRGCSYGFIVERTECLPTTDLVHLLWAEVLMRVNAQASSSLAVPGGD